jgi:hypothetical protein
VGILVPTSFPRESTNRDSSLIPHPTGFGRFFARRHCTSKSPSSSAMSAFPSSRKWNRRSSSPSPIVRVTCGTGCSRSQDDEA